MLHSLEFKNYVKYTSSKPHKVRWLDSNSIYAKENKSECQLRAFYRYKARYGHATFTIVSFPGFQFSILITRLCSLQLHLSASLW